MTPVTLSPIVTGMPNTPVICKNPGCGKAFTPQRAGAQYCSGRCRVAAHRRRKIPATACVWLGKAKRPSAKSRSLNAGGTAALSNAALADRLLELARTGDDGEPKTGRRYWYLALSRGYVQPDMGASDEAKKSRAAAQKRITDLLGELRKSGRLGWEMVLDLTRDLDQWQTYRSPREARADLRESYTEDRWIGQRYYPLLIVEKDTMEPVCKPMADRWQMPFASSRGYGSLKLQHDVAQMLVERYRQYKQPAVVYFVSDLDPSGLDLQHAWEEALANFGVVAVFERIGLTPEQVEDPGLDLDGMAIDVKPSDSRSKRYLERYGLRFNPSYAEDGIGRCWECDVLPSGVIEAAIRLDILSWLDTTAWRLRHAEIERNRALL